MASLPLAFLSLAVGGLLVETGLTDAPGGPVGELGRLLSGKGFSKLKAPVLFSAGGSPNVDPNGFSAPGGGPWVGGTAKGAAVVKFAQGYVGVPYAWGGESPAGVDCSGLTQLAYKSVGVSIPRVAAAQQMLGASIAWQDAAPGDLVFYGVPAHHVMIALGDGRNVIHAPHPGASVRVEQIWQNEGAVTARRILT